MADPFTHTAGFGGLCAVVAAVIATTGVLLTLAQRSRTDRKQQWWGRFIWVVDHSADDLGIAVTASILDQLTTTARKLGDDDLLALAERYTRHVYAGLRDPSPGSRHRAQNGHEQEGDPR